MSNPVTPLPPGEAKGLEAGVVTDPYYLRVFIALDVFFNVLLLNGHCDETISSHAARAATLGKRWGIYLCKFLNVFAKNHGASAEATDVGRAQTVINLETNSGNLPKG